MTSLKVAETLKELRHHRGFTQKQLSEQLHISRQAYSNYENGTRLPDLETACVIADYFQITKPSISHHLSILKNSGLIIDERQGQNIVYSIDMTVFQDMMKWFMNFMDMGDKK